jgi:PTH1 family peptidyl-tRNA hydrolase
MFWEPGMKKKTKNFRKELKISKACLSFVFAGINNTMSAFNGK